jgi:hypothetical protein
MISKTPLLDDLKVLMDTITDGDIEYVKHYSPPLEKDEKLLGISLGATLEDMLEPARAYVLMGNLSAQRQKIIDGTMEFPAGTDLVALTHMLEMREDMCAHLLALGISKMAFDRRIPVPDNSNFGITLHEGAFHAIAIPARDDEPLMGEQKGLEDDAGEEELAETPGASLIADAPPRGRFN